MTRPENGVGFVKNAPIRPSLEANGFTLIEVMVALAIAVPALALLYQQGVQAVATSHVSAAYQEAISRAQSHLALLTGTALTPGELQGDEGNGFHWHTVVSPLGTIPAAARPGQPQTRATTLYAVRVDMAWGSRSLTLRTRRLGTSAGTAP